MSPANASAATGDGAGKRKANLEVLRVLIVHGGANVDLKDDQERTPLDIMRAAGQTKHRRFQERIGRWCIGAGWSGSGVYRNHGGG